MDDLLKEWQVRLRLQEWRITVEVVTLKVLHKRSESAGSGCTDFDEWNKIASVYILNEEEFNEDGDALEAYDAEAILVHELLHCRIPVSPADMDKKDEYLFESGLEQVAQVLVGMKRER